MTPTVPHQALYRRWRAQTFSQIVGQEAVVETLRNAVRTERVAARAPVRRSARDRQDLAGPDHGQGRQLHEPPGRRSVRRLRCLRGHPRGDDPRRPRDRCRVQPRDQRGPRAARPARLSAGPPAPQGLHPRRGPPDHARCLERAPEVARGAARLRDLHVRLDRAVGLPAGDPVAAPALRRPAPHRPGDRGQAGADPRSRRPDRSSPARSRSSPASPPAACATPSRSSTSCCR